MKYVDYYTQWTGIVNKAKQASQNVSSHPVSSNIGQQLSNVIDALNNMTNSSILTGDDAVSGLATSLKGQISTLSNIQSFFSSYSQAEQAYITLDEDLTKLKEEDAKFKKLSNEKPNPNDFKETIFNSFNNENEEKINYTKYNRALSKWEESMKTLRQNCYNLNTQITVCLNCLDSFASASPAAGGVNGSWNFEKIELVPIDYDYNNGVKTNSDSNISSLYGDGKIDFTLYDMEVIHTNYSDNPDGALDYIKNNFKEGTIAYNAAMDFYNVTYNKNEEVSSNPKKDTVTLYDLDRIETKPEEASEYIGETFTPEAAQRAENFASSVAEIKNNKNVLDAKSRIDEARNQKLEKADAVLSDKSPQQATVNTNHSNLNVRMEPNGKIIESIPKDSTVRVIRDEGNGWTKVKLSDGTTGYVFNKYLKDNSELVTSSVVSPSNVSNYVKNDNPVLSVVSTKGSNLNLRSGPGTNNSKIGSIHNNSHVEVLGTSGNWSYVKVGSNEGWVYSDYLNKKNI